MNERRGISRPAGRQSHGLAHLTSAWRRCRILPTPFLSRSLCLSLAERSAGLVTCSPPRLPADEFSLSLFLFLSVWLSPEPAILSSYLNTLSRGVDQHSRYEGGLASVDHHLSSIFCYLRRFVLRPQIPKSPILSI